MDLINSMIGLLVGYHELILEGIYHTLLLAIFGTICGSIFGLVLAAMRVQQVRFNDSLIVKIIKRLLKVISIIYVDVVRGTPMMVQATVFFFGLAYGGIHLDPLLAGFIVVSFNTSAYICEIIRSGINSISKGQKEAGEAIGLSDSQIMIYIVLPQALKNSLPALMNELIVNVKDTSVLSVIGVTELFYMTKAAASQTYETFAAYLLAAIIYLILTKTLTLIFSFVLSKSLNKNNKNISMPQSQTVPEVVNV